MKHPEWVLKHKAKGTEIRKIGNNYYLYKISSKWDSKHKRTKKVTDEYLGAIKPDGLIKPKKKRVLESLKFISVKEFGATNYLWEENQDIVEQLKRIYPADWKEIFSFAAFRLLFSSPIKNLREHYVSSYISDTIAEAHLSPKKVSTLLGELGKGREKIKTFLKTFIRGNEFILIDLTHVFSLSENVISSVPGHNSKREFLPQLHLIFLFSADRHMPTYFRMVAGSICDVSSLLLTVKESGIRNVVIIGDKGFYSEDNVRGLRKDKDLNLRYILPLKRNSSLIDYSVIKQGNKRAFDGYFLFDERAVWYYSYVLSEGELKGNKMFVFVDDRLKTEEEKDYLSRIDKTEKNSIDGFFDIEHRQGTISVITNVEDRGEKIYVHLKSRVEIEIMYDAFKNILHADRIYLRDDAHVEGWMFINFIALVLYYRLYNVLGDCELLKRFSPKDILLHLSRFHKLKVDEQWIPSEIPKKTRDVMEKLNIPVT